MINTASQHLYVMQNEFGLIKIGRSIDPDTRIYHLRKTERCQIELVAVFANYGADEESIHLSLSDYRLFGEWFAGDDEARAAVEAEINCSTPIEWPFAYDDERAEVWLDHMRVVRSANYIRKAIYREITILRQALEANGVLDGNIAFALNLAATGERAAPERPSEHYGDSRTDRPECTSLWEDSRE